MKDKERQIEELAKMMCGHKDCNACGLNGICQFKGIAKKLIENSVVLSQDEYNRLKRDSELYEVRHKKNLKLFAKAYNQGSKETAEKFVNLSDSDILVVDTQEYGEIEVVSVERLQEIAREFSVEIKEKV